MIAAMALPAVSTQNMLRWMLFGVLAMGMLSLNSGSGTLAFFTTQVQSNNNTFTAGNLRFNILDSISTTGQYPSVGSSLSLLNMKPSDVVYAPIQLNNVGNLTARYGVKYSTTTVLANNSNGGVISGTGTTLVDSGRTALNGLSFSAASYGSLVNDFVLITGGASNGDFRKITVVAPTTLTVTPAFTATPDATTLYSIVRYAGSITAGATTTTFTDSTATWAVNQWVGYTATQGANTGTVVSHTASVLTVGSAMGGAPVGTYTISPTNLASALKLAIVGKGTGTAAASPPLSGAGALNCNAANFANAAVWQEQAASATSPARPIAPMLAIGETITTAGAATGTSMVATTGLDVLCMEVLWTDGGAPGSLTTGDNAFNGANAGAYSTNINFTFDGQ
jgi:predicted ribosomally synthesized peptide with SipW-like signal peptide